jgi:hypothetical protein
MPAVALRLLEAAHRLPAEPDRRDRRGAASHCGGESGRRAGRSLPRTVTDGKKALRAAAVLRARDPAPSPGRRAGGAAFRSIRPVTGYRSSGSRAARRTPSYCSVCSPRRSGARFANETFGRSDREHRGCRVCAGPPEAPRCELVDPADEEAATPAGAGVTRKPGCGRGSKTTWCNLWPITSAVDAGNGPGGGSGNC